MIKIPLFYSFSKIKNKESNYIFVGDKCPRNITEKITKEKCKKCQYYNGDFNWIYIMSKHYNMIKCQKEYKQKGNNDVG